MTSAGWRTRLAPHAVAIAFGVGLVLAVVPLLTTRVLPFHDASGIIGLGGALALRDDSRAAVSLFYDLDIRAYPSALYFGWAYLAGAIGVPVELAFSVFLAIFCLCGPPLAVWAALRAFRRPPVLALLVFPISYHHQIWYGFLGSSAAIAGLVFALACARRCLDGGPKLGSHLGLAAVLLFVASAHPFPLALTLAVLVPFFLWPVGRGRARLVSYGARAATLMPMAIFLGKWAAGFFGRGGGGGHRSLWRILRTSVGFEAPGLGHFTDFVDWLGDGYVGAADAIVPLVGLLTLVVLLTVGVRSSAVGETALEPIIAKDNEEGVSGRATTKGSWARLGVWLAAHRDGVLLGWAAGVLALLYCILPMKLVWPELWWGVRVRCVVPLYLVAILLVRPRSVGRALPPFAVVPAFGVALVFFAFVAWDFAHYFRGRVLDGFDEVVAEIPEGQSVLGFPVRPDPHYSLPHPYLVQHVVARKGGRAVPHLRGHPGSYWITMKPPPDSPPWGDPMLFRWPEHAGFDYFLIEQPVGEPAPEPMRQAPPGAVRLVRAAGQFALWQRVTP